MDQVSNQVSILEGRIRKAKAALRAARLKEKQREEKRLLETFRRSGLSALDLQKLLDEVVKKNEAPNSASE